MAFWVYFILQIYFEYYFFLGMEEFYSYKEKNSTKKTKQGNKIHHKKKKKYNYITMYNYKLYTIARLVPNKSIQAVQLIY